ncbi:MAG TPA: hypothetical protein VGZ02_12935 [Candidatus Baltobacteraceae bacterium]|jgi:hypothetical protein|nr:hypothetical protein [Candidatus Baltobacteraceae bacterium]
MSTYGVDRYNREHGEIAIHLDAPAANRILLALEHLDQGGGLEPALDDLRQSIKVALVTKSSGDTDSAPSSGE